MDFFYIYATTSIATSSQTTVYSAPFILAWLFEFALVSGLLIFIILAKKTD